MNKKYITPGAMEELKKIEWTGNIRELRNVLERLVILSGDKITEEDVITLANPKGNRTGSLDVVTQFEKFQDFKEYAEKIFIDAKLKRNGWNVAKTATEIDIQRSHLYNKIEKYNLKRSDKR
jgi:DNA-binding NtrC family response regulator